MEDVTALLKSQEIYIQRFIALDNMLLTATISFFTILFIGLYRAWVERKEHIYVFLPFVIGLYGLFCIYVRAAAVCFIQAAIEIEQDIMHLTGQPTGMVVKLYQIGWFKVPATLFYSYGTVMLAGLLFYSSWRGIHIVKSEHKRWFILSIVGIVSANLVSLVWTFVHIIRVMSNIR